MDYKEEIRTRLPEYVASVTEPDTNGGHGFYICPLCGSGTGKGHGKADGAFSIHADGIKWHCFSCGNGGDIFDLIGMIENLSDFKSQYKKALEVFGYPLEENKPESAPEADSGTGLAADSGTGLALREEIRKYAKALIGSEGEKYLRGRGLSSDTIAALQFGYNQETRRIIIPYPDEDYYITRSIDTKDYKKPSGDAEPLFWIGRKNADLLVFITEGQIDAISLYQAGASSVISLGGIGYTKLKSVTLPQRVIYVRDNDDAGKNAAKNVEKVLKEKGIQHVIANPPDTQGYKNFMGLISLIPEWKVKCLMNIYKETAMEWLDRLYKCVSPYAVELLEYISEVNNASDCYDAVEKEMEQLSKMKPSFSPTNVSLDKPVKPNPLLAKPFTSELSTTPALQSVLSRKLYDTRYPEVDRMFSLFEKAQYYREKDKKSFNAFNDCLGVVNQLICDIVESGYLTDCFDYYDKVAEQMEPLDIQNPYAMCFAFLMLVETGSDFPWMCGLNTGVLNEIAAHLPWNVTPYRESKDDFWAVFTKEDLENAEDCPDDFAYAFDTKQYLEPKFDDGKMSFEQILFMKTGCMLPADLWKYQRLAPELKKAGLSEKEIETMLMMMAALGQARRQIALPANMPKGEEEETEPDGEAAENWQEEIKTLRAALKKSRAGYHDAEQENRALRNELDDVKEESERNRRELADLRELIFNLQQGVEQVTNDGVDEAKFPYTVRSGTLIFGGHDSWLKGMKAKLAGDVRFIGKDYLFNTNIIKKADIIWIQTNALSHKQYWRIADTARQLKKPIRYFQNASAGKCSEQVMEWDQKNETPLKYAQVPVKRSLSPFKRAASQ